MSEPKERNLDKVAPAFIEMAHQIVWATVATVDSRNRPRTRMLHPLWTYADGELSGIILTGRTPPKVAHLEHSSFVSCGYWAPSQDTCRADCEVEWLEDDELCLEAWNNMKSAPAPVGYDPAMIPGWSDGPTSASFSVLKLKPTSLRVFPGTVLLGGSGSILRWSK